MVLLTGTPMPNSFLDLWSQIFLLDRGARLGERFTGFRDKYFEKDPYRPFVWKLRSNSGDNWAEKEIAAKISDICISLQEKDYLQLPERIDRIVELELTEVERKAYERFEKDEVLKLADKEITAVNAAGLTNKLLQFANGAVYDEDKTYHEVHVQKLDRLEEILEDAAGHPVLVAYSYQSDIARLKARFPHIRELQTDADVQDWNAGKIPLAAAHPASASWGLNLQAGGHIIVWFGLPWRLEIYQQFNKRLHRQGQLYPVIIHHLLMGQTADFDVLKALQFKENNQEVLMDLVKARIKKYLK